MHPALTTLPDWALDYFPTPGKGVIYNLPAEDYHGTKALLSKSALDVFGGKTPAHYLASLDVEREKPTDAMNAGSAFHIAVLEPDLWSRKVLILPDLDMRSSRNRELRDQIIREDGAGKVHLKPEFEPVVMAMAKSVRAHPAARRLFKSGRSEVTGLWTCPETGLYCKARADFLPDAFPIAVDLKSALSAAPAPFAKAAADHRYHVQDPFYSRIFSDNGLDVEHFVFVVVEKEPPYAVACYQLDETARLKGEELYMAELRRMRECRDSDTWPCYGDAVMDLALPVWSTRTESV